MSHETDTQALVSSEPERKRMTDADRALALKLAGDGISQTAIARRLGFSQQAVSAWLGLCRDTVPEAKQFLRGQALSMARNVRYKGRPSEHLAALKGVGVLEDEKQSGVTVLVGAGGTVNLGPLNNYGRGNVIDAESQDANLEKPRD